MRIALKRLTAVAGIGVVLATAAPVASAAAAAPVQPPSNPLAALTGFLPNMQQQPGTCGPNQGLPFGFLNLGPTGPLGPLGAMGPLGPGHLPCGASVFNLGPTGPLGPSGPLGSLSGGQQ